MNSIKIGYKMTGRLKKPLLDLNDSDFLKRNPCIKDHITSAPDGTPNVLRWQATEVIPDIELGERFSMNDYSHMCFRVYNEKATGTTVKLRYNLVPDNDRYLQGGTPHTNITLDFEGWKEFRILRDHLTVAFPPPFFTSISLVSSEGALDGCIEENVLYFEYINAEKDKLELDVPAGVDLSDPALYEGMLCEFEKIYIGTEESRELDQYISRVNRDDPYCESAWAQFKETWCDGEKGKLFGCDIQRRPWVDEYTITRMYTSLFRMACSYSRPKSKYYKNPELLEDVKKGLEYVYKNYYGENLYTSTTYGNWWPWWIGTPSQYLPILVILRHELGFELTCKYAQTIKFLMPFPYGAGSNKLNMTKHTLLAGALMHDAEYICVSKHFALPDLNYFSDSSGGDGGFYKDGSFIQHNSHPYHRGYGLELLQGLTALMSFLQNTPFEFTEECAENQYVWIFENFRHQIFNTNFSACNAGRSVTRGPSEIGMCKELCKQMINMRSYAPEKWKGKFDSLIRRLMLNFKDDLSYSVAPHLAKYCAQLYKDESVNPEPPYLTTRVFTRMARVAHHGKKYGAALNMSSDTIHKYESINKENEQGWYFSDGFLFVYPYDNVYDYDGHYFLFANPYLRAGVTANTAERIAKCISPSFPNASSYAGGVELDKYGIAGFELGYKESVMYHGTHKHAKDTKITARKSWFFFDNEIVCLGSGINDFSETPVITCVENRRWREHDALCIDGKEILPTEKISACAKSAHFTNMGGYVFFDGEKTTFKKETRSNMRNPDDTKTHDFLEIVIEHGNGNGQLNASYAYAYLPTASKEETEGYSACPDVTVVANTKKAHAVYEKTLDILAINFFEADTVTFGDTTVKSDSPLSIMICGDDISVSDPTKKLDELKFSINGKEYTVTDSDTLAKTLKIKI